MSTLGIVSQVHLFEFLRQAFLFCNELTEWARLAAEPQGQPAFPIGSRGWDSILALARQTLY